MNADATLQPLGLQPAVCDLRRALGPMPWVALEVLASRSHEIDGVIVAFLSVRALAAGLGVAKDTAARALGTLRTKGVIALCQSRTPLGHFAARSYMIVTPDVLGIGPSGAPEPAKASSTARPSKPRPRPTIAPAQLSLLEAD
jgi:hypothetical protein